MKIKVFNPNNLPKVDYRKVESIQGNFKKLSLDNEQKLLSSLRTQGFFIPFFIWENEGKYYSIDGVQRTKVLKKYEIEPFELPYIKVEAVNMEDAKKKVLIASSQYGKATNNGFFEFTKDLDIKEFEKNITFQHFKKEIPVELESDAIAEESQKAIEIRIKFANQDDADKFRRKMGYNRAVKSMHFADIVKKIYRDD